MVQISTGSKRTTVSVMNVSSRLTGRAELCAFPSPLNQTKPPKKQLLSFCRSQSEKCGLSSSKARLSERSFSRSGEIENSAGSIEEISKRGRRKRSGRSGKREPDKSSERSNGNSNYYLSRKSSPRSPESVSVSQTRRSTDRAFADEGKWLLWDFMELLLRQNGKLLGSDVADLLVEDDDECFYSSVSSGLNSTRSDGEFDEPLDLTAILIHFRKLLERGKMAEAIDWAFANKKEGHGLYLTMMLDSVIPGSHVLSALQRLERELAPDDSLLTLYYLLTDRQPPISVKAVDSSNWRHHVAIAVSNLSDDSKYHSTLKRFLTSLAESLNSLGLLCAAHLCQLLILWTASSLPSVSIPVIGLSYSLPHRSQDSTSAVSSSSASNWKIPSSDLIQLTEIHEYLITHFGPIVFDDSAKVAAVDEANAAKESDPLQQPTSSAVHRNFSAYKLIYAQRLLEAGLPKRALSYCFELYKTVRFESLPNRVLASQVKSVAMRALLEDRTFYSSFVTRRNSFSDALPSWLLELD